MLASTFFARAPRHSPLPVRAHTLLHLRRDCVCRGRVRPAPSARPAARPSSAREEQTDCCGITALSDVDCSRWATPELRHIHHLHLRFTTAPPRPPCSPHRRHRRRHARITAPSPARHSPWPRIGTCCRQTRRQRTQAHSLALSPLPQRLNTADNTWRRWWKLRTAGASLPGSSRSKCLPFLCSYNHTSCAPERRRRHLYRTS